MLRVSVKGRHAAIVRELELPVPFDLGQFVTGLERQRDRPIRLRPFSAHAGRTWAEEVGPVVSALMAYATRNDSTQQVTCPA